MKQGRTLTELAAELTRQREAKRDFVADTRKVTLVAPESKSQMKRLETQIGSGHRLAFSTNGGEEQESFGITDTAHAQIASRLNVPKKYYDRLRSEHPDLLAENVNTLFQREPEKRMLRTLDGSVRAFLSERYRPLDNDELAEAVFPALSALDVQILSCEVTPHRMYIKFVTDRVQGEVAEGDVVQAGGVISNSEIGQGALRVDDLDYRLVCLNGMIRATVAKSTHVGRAAGFEGFDAQEFFKDETRKADDKALFLKLRDTVGAMFSQERFDRRLEQYREAAEEVMEAPAIETVQVVQKRLALTDGQRDSVLTHLLKDGDLSKWGLANAVTRASQDVADYDEATELEKLGGQIVELPKSDWASICEEAAAA